ncbi:TonB-dependent receptor [Thermomonas flagellata]|uniref:TonB-dependent receptor n=1 Tax=Thermomonas flagellata TaxID=2888524 RepID=UPI001F03AE3F|nr:TonB-dependent receptor [Thermomonas flagellata]
MQRTHRSTTPRSTPHRTLLACALASCLMLGGAPALAQSANATLRGKAPAGAEVTAVNTATGQVRKVKVAADGSFALTGLPPGTYKVEAGPGTEKTVTLAVATSVNLDLLPPGQGGVKTLDTVTATGVALQEVKTSEVGNNVSLKTISTLPQVSRNFLEFADTVPGMQFEANPNGTTQLRGGAQTTSAINVFIDGVGQKNYVLTGGITGQDQSRGNPFPQLAIGEYKVITSNYKAEYDQVASAVVIAATRSGTNEFSGEIFGRYTDTGLRSRTVSEVGAGAAKQKTEQKEYGVALGGPIIRDRMHYFVSYEAKDFVVSMPPVAVPNQWASFAGFLPAAAKDQLGPATAPFKEDLYFAKFDWDLGMDDRIELSFKRRDENGRTDVGGITAASASKINYNTEDRYDLRWTHYGAAFMNEARLTYEDALFNPRPYRIGNQSIYTVGINPNNVLLFADATSALAIQRKGQKGPAFQNDITFNSFDWHGSHVIKAGVKIKHVELIQSENSDLIPSFRYAVNDGSLPPSPYTPVGTNAIPYQVNFNAPFAGAAPIVTTKSRQIGLYVQDDWDVTDKLQLNIGVRWDYEKIPSYVDYVTPPEVVAALTGPGTNPAVSATYAQQLAKGGININDYISNGHNRKVDKNNFAPRLGFSYDINGDESLVFFGGFGRSYDRNLYDYMGLEQVKSALASYQIQFVQSTGCTPAPGSCVNWDPKYLNGVENLQALVTSRVRNGEIDLLNNNLKTPYSDQMSLGLRARLVDWNVSAALSNVHSKEGFVFTLGNRYPDGKFWSAPSWNANDVAQPWEHAPPGFGPLILGNNGIETKTSQLLLSAEKPYDKASGWGVTVAYTYSHAKGNRGGDEHYSFDAPTIADYPFIYLSVVPKHRLVATAIRDLPWDVTLSAKLTLASPPPLNAIVGWWEYGASPRPPLIVAAFPPQSIGTKQLDLALSKDFRLFAGMTFQLRADAINVFNNKNYNSYNINWGSNGIYNPVIDLITTGGGVNSYTTPRTYFLSGRLSW